MKPWEIHCKCNCDTFKIVVVPFEYEIPKVYINCWTCDANYKTIDYDKWCLSE